MVSLAESPVTSIRVLLVEDDTIDQLAFTRCVKQLALPYDYTIAGSLAEAKAILAERSFDVAILDFYLGDGNSLELIEPVKSQHLPFIVATGSGDEETAVQMMQQGAHDYLIKDPEHHYLKVLASTVNQAIARKQSENQVRLLTQSMQGIRDGIYIVDANGCLTFINNALSEICGVPFNTAIGRPIGWLGQDALTHHVSQNTSCQGATCNQEVEMTLVRPDGSTFVASLSESWLQDGGRSLRVGVIRDITPLKQVELELRLSQDSLEQTVKQRTQELQQTNRELQSEIQERLKVEESLRNSHALIQQQQQFLYSVIDSNPNLIFVKDWDGRYQLVNQAMAEFLDTAVDDLLGRRDAELHPNSEATARFLSENRQVITTQQPLFLPEENLILRGQEHWLQWQKCPIQLPGSGTVGVLGVGVNITARKQIELSLQASEQRFASLAEVAPVGIFRTDYLGNCVYVNAHWCQITGLNPEEAAGQGWTQALHPDDRERIAFEWYQSAQENRPFKLEYRFLRADGTVMWVFGQSSAEHDGEGQLVGYIGTITDISDRKRSEDALRASEAYQRALIRSLPDLLMRLDLDGRYLEFIAPPTFRVIGDVNSMIGSSIHDNLPADVAQVRMDLMRRALQTGTIQFYEQDLSSNGTVQIEEVRVVPCGEKEALLLVRDISDRKQAELTLQKVVAGTAAVTGEDFFPALVRHIAEALNVCYVLVTEKVGEELCSLGFWAHGALQPSIAYLPARTPCEYTLKDGEFHCESLVQDLFPDNVALVTMQADSYLGIALKDSVGRAIGNLCILDVEPLSQAKRATSIPLLQVFAARAAAELQRKAATHALHQLNQDLEARVEQRTLELQSRESQLRDLFDNATDLIQSIDFEGKILFVNAAWKRTLGYNDADLATLSIFQIIHPADLEHCQVIMHHLLEGESSVRIETRFLTKCGREIRVEGNVNAQLKDGRPVATRGIFRDITERNRAEQQLRASEKRYATLTAMAPVGIFRADAQGNCVYVNGRWCKIAGLSPVEAVGMGWIRALYPPDRKRYHAEWQRASQAGEPFNLEYRFQHMSGALVWVFGQAVQERDLDGVVSGYVVTVTDISDRKCAEEAIALQLRRQQTLGAIT
ncbi:MAG TPA: PAS domain S-box protein, partial [Chroococcidiopsis sp.]